MLRRCSRVTALSVLGLMAAGGAMAQTGGANRDASGPQAGVPAPLPSGQADVPGGSSHNGIITPPKANLAEMPTIKPSLRSEMPVIKPPAANDGTGVQPK